MKALSKINTALALGLIACTMSASAATITVPTMQPTIAAAIAAANTGDEIRVQNTFVETTTGNALTGKSITIRSYDAAYATPTAGATWVLPSGGSGTTGGLITLSSAASLTIDGFSQITAPAGTGFYVNSNCTVTATNCTFSGFALANTAAICTPPVAPPATDVNITVANCAFNANGRAIYFFQMGGTSSMTVTDSTFSAHTSNYLEYRVIAGTHTLNMTGCTVNQTANSPLRLYAFNTAAGATVNYTANIDRSSFTSGSVTALGGHIALSGYGTDAVTGANPSSVFNLTITNSIFDMRQATNSSANTFPIGTVGGLAAATERKGNIAVRHCTFLLNNAGAAAISIAGFNAGAFTFDNGIVDGLANAALRNDGTGTLTSGKNLFNTAAFTTGTGTITLSGSEITGVSPQFVSASDFHLQNTSPALNVATASAVSVDFDGNARPFGAASDLGAYELQSAPPSSTESWTMYR